MLPVEGDSFQVHRPQEPRSGGLPVNYADDNDDDDDDDDDDELITVRWIETR